MPIPLQKYATPYRRLVKDVRPVSQRMAEYFDQPAPMATMGCIYAAMMIVYSRRSRPLYRPYRADGLASISAGPFTARLICRSVCRNMPNMPDPRNPPPGKNGPGKSEGILYIGNTSDADNPDCGQEMWFTNNDARTHILYLGTTGSGKTEGLKALVTNALAWGSGYVYVDGKADTDLWASLYAVARRFGRDDDLLGHQLHDRQFRRRFAVEHDESVLDRLELPISPTWSPASCRKRAAITPCGKNARSR